MNYSFIEHQRERVERSLKLRKSDFDLPAMDVWDRDRRKLQTEVDQKRAQLNTLSQEMEKLFKDKSVDPKKREEVQKKSGNLKKEIQEGEKNLAEKETQLTQELLYLPNVLHESVTEGKGSQDNPVIREWGEPKKPVSKPKTHEILGVDLGILDLERASKATGARFAYLRGWGARLERALISFMMDLHRENGYEEMWPPFLTSRNSMTGTGQLPKFAEDAFQISDPDFFLVPTAEVPVTNYFREEILKESDLPQSFVAYSPCFRREAGSYGKDTKGLIRQHQFDKVELVKFTKPEDSYKALEALTQHAEEVLQKLEISYRVVSLCSADIGFASAKTYDIEVWLPGQGMYREISSCSNFEDFQSRRAEIKFKPKDGGKPKYVHTLNGSGLAVGRTWIAILENFQKEDGSITIPKALSPYLQGAKEIRVP